MAGFTGLDFYNLDTIFDRLGGDPSSGISKSLGELSTQHGLSDGAVRDLQDLLSRQLAECGGMAYLTPEERDIRDAVREWVDDRLLPIIEDHCREGTFPAHLVPEIADMGLLGLNLDGYGCAGLSNVAYGLVCQELERGDSGIRSFCSVQGSLSMFPIWRYGTEEQKQRYLPEMAAGRLIGCFGLTEPDHGSNPGGMMTRAVDDGDSYVLNGAKMWITNGTIAGVAIVWAKLDGVIRGFIVERDDPGFDAPEMGKRILDEECDNCGTPRHRAVIGKHSLRASVTSELTFQDCRIPKDRILGDVRGLKGPFSCLNNARFGIAWGAIGAAMACFGSARDYAGARLQFDRPIASFQLIQNKLAWMLREITKAQLLALHLGRMKDAGVLTPEHVSLAKMNNVDIALQIARMARDIHGANGILDEYPVMRHMANLESVYTYEGTHDIHNLILGRWITGIPSFASETLADRVKKVDSLHRSGRLSDEEHGTIRSALEAANSADRRLESLLQT